MTIGDEDLRMLYRHATIPERRREECLPAQVIAALALGGEASETDVAHLSECSSCAEEYLAIRAAAPARATDARLGRSLQTLAIAASVAVAIVLGGFAAALVSRNRMLTAQLQNRNPAPTISPAKAAPVLNVAIVDLEPSGSSFRGHPNEEKTDLPAAESYTFILNTNPGKKYGNYSIEIVRAPGLVVWSGQGLRPSPHDTFTLHVPRALFKNGEYRIHLFGIAGGTRMLVESYSIRVPQS